MTTSLIHASSRRGTGTTAIMMAAILTIHAHAAESPIVLTVDQARGGDITTVRLAADDRSANGRVTVTGRVEMAERGPDPVLAPANAMVVAVYAHPGDTVAAGAPIVAVAGAGTVALRQTLQEAETLMKSASQRTARDQMLYADGIISLTRLEQSKSAEALATGQLAGQRRLLGAARFESGGRLLLKAPRAGFVSGPPFGTGDSVTMGQLVAYVGTPQPPLVSLDAPASIARGLRLGDQLAVRSRGCTATAVLHAVGRTVDPDTQTVALHGEVDAPSCLLPGEIVTATVTSQTLSRKGFAVPASTFVRRGNATYLFLLADPGYLPVVVDAEAARSGFALAAELHAGSEVVVRGAALLKAEWLKRGAI